MIEPERAILADRDALARTEKLLAKPDLHPLVRQAHEADARYLRSLIDRYERQYALMHDID